jgi:hypothetical protein
VGALIVTVQVVAVPEQAPLQPENALPVAGAAVSVTRVPLANGWLHPLEPEQLIPAGLEVTVPLPATVTCSESFCTAGAKVAPTVSVGALIVTVQVVAVPEQAPLQPENASPVAGAAVSVTRVPLANVWLHPLEPEQLIPAGLEVTVPLPATVTCSESFCTAAAKLAPTVWAAFIVTVHVVAVPEHAPLHPENANPVPGTAVSVTLVPAANVWLHPVEPPVQLMPAGVELTLPVPPSVT